MVGAAAGVLVCDGAFEFAGVAGGVLRAGAAVQLSTLHGYVVPGVSLVYGICEVPDIYGACGGAAGARGFAGACVVSGAALDFHLIYLLESVALHGAEFR